MMMVVVYYMTNYAMKYDVSQYQLILAAAMLKCMIEAAKTVSDLSERQLRIRHQDMNKFVL